MWRVFYRGKYGCRYDDGDFGNICMTSTCHLDTCFPNAGNFQTSEQLILISFNVQFGIVTHWYFSFRPLPVPKPRGYYQRPRRLPK